jgi:hypothetical protein
MELKIEIGFDQLLDAVKQLPDEQRAKLKAELNKKPKTAPALNDFQKFLLNGPVMSDEQYKEYVKS